VCLPNGGIKLPVIDIKDYSTFQRELENSSEDVIVKFEADWCSPCKAVQPIVEEVARQNPEIKFLSVDIEGDGIDPLISEYGIRSVPTFVRLRQGRPVASTTGTITKKELTCFLKG